MGDRSSLPNYGIDAELAAKAQAGRDVTYIEGAYRWIGEVTGTSVTSLKELQNGKILCEVINKIPNAKKIEKISDKTMRAFQEENIQKFTKACADLGVPPSSLFQPAVLYEGATIDDPATDPKASDMSVAKCIYALNGVLHKHGWSGPTIGIKQIDPNERQFSEEQLNAGKGIAPKIAQGSSGGASQAGMVDMSRNIARPGYEGQYS